MPQPEIGRQAESAEEYFELLHHVYDIRAARRLIAADPGRPTQKLPVRETARIYTLDRTREELREQHVIPLIGRPDEEYALAHADLSVPVIIADVSNTFIGEGPEHTLVDGFHRLRRAFVEGVENLEAYVLNAQESWDIRVDSEKERRGERELRTKRAQ
ncbi:hypothetical protein [Streptomyces sp. NPDC059278]|uniref:hypothetical protein n=1 Tax=Streptomyces sp. NPDC059278 TaxID=3346801 RepID=UPI003696569F